MHVRASEPAVANGVRWTCRMVRHHPVTFYGAQVDLDCVIFAGRRSQYRGARPLAFPTLAFARIGAFSV